MTAVRRSLPTVVVCVATLAGCSLDADVEPSTASVSGPLSSAATAAGAYDVGERLTGQAFAALTGASASEYARVHVEISGESGGVQTRVEGDLDASDPADLRLALTRAEPDPALLVLAGGVLYSGTAGGPFGRGDPGDLPFGLERRLGEAALGYVDSGAVTGAKYLGDEDVAGVSAQHLETEGRGAMAGAEVWVADGRVVRFVGESDEGAVTVTFSAFGERVVIEPPEKGQDLLG